jgi:hypothetical protein
MGPAWLVVCPLFPLETCGHRLQVRRPICHSDILFLIHNTQLPSEADPLDIQCVPVVRLYAAPRSSWRARPPPKSSSDSSISTWRRMSLLACIAVLLEVTLHGERYCQHLILTSHQIALTPLLLSPSHTQPVCCENNHFNGIIALVCIASKLNTPDLSITY